ncbi:bifunctional methylenetetrahydrofolate dehydrogenase/methenyltetrahydrofolate cyclohydrolase FolD [Shouchella lonarensis]|uniref:Bifunctional protein FolD n=1 Tax=Shouchella lonarensis TaxID=1464122 RepID=A0A1G6IGG0_9BACI|nr:bifunctional methylenetetrahydrofolate dehydrogenase/methenyltetrahydrofolate cyclohydrolase FolD [Shouchella lonarensis]SDC04826.1 methenyltetrahydrofolate cyclohydrolase /5,10-methylenetetrahydrofolate dehydrogenase (NADP+) [Shouchella lonarensis]
MSATIIDGKQLAQKKGEMIKTALERLKTQGITPGLAVMLVGEDPASETYVRNKQRACERMGIHSRLIRLPTTATEQHLLDHVVQLNEDPHIDGILVQLPLPVHISTETVIRAISPEKDVDCFHPLNVGKMILGETGFLPCTPHGILVMLKEIGVTLSGKHVVVVGRSHIVGKPVGQLLLNEDATVTYCHSRTENLSSFTKQADILIVAVGRANLITEADVKEGAIVIDVGMNRVNNKLVGDVEFASVRDKAAFLTPVPGGVGPMTITMLLENTVYAATKARAVMA